MSNISFILFTYNEEKRIEYAIRNFISYGEVYILDGGSTDSTKEISEKMGAHFLTRADTSKPQVETQENLDFVKNHIKTDWIYWGYVDNIAPKSLVEKMAEVSLQDHYKMVLVPLRTFLWGNTDNYIQKAHSPFFFHKDFMDYTDNYIHGMGKFLGNPDQILKLPNTKELALHHFSTYNMHKFILGHLRYAEQEALEKYRSGKKSSSMRMLGAMLRYCWIYRGSFKNGLHMGLIIISAYATFRLMAYTTLYELERNITLEKIEENYSKAKEKILRESGF